MNDNYNNNNGQRNEETEKERIRFDDSDFGNPYSNYYSDNGSSEYENYANTDRNPYSKYYTKEKYEPFFSELQDQEKIKRHFSRLGFGYAMFSVISLTVATIIGLVVYFIDPDFYFSTLFTNLLTPLALYVFGLPALLIVLSGCEAKAPQKRRMGFGEWLLFLIASFGIMYIGSLIGNAVMSYLSTMMNYEYGNAIQKLVDNDNLYVTAIFTVIVAPIGEEFVFRKLVIDRMQKYGPLISIGFSALMFGLMHANLYQFFYCFALGIVLGYIYHTTGKLYLTIAIHAIVNFIGGIVPSLISPVTDALLAIDPEDPTAMLSLITEQPYAILGLLVFTFFIYASMACAIIFPIAFRKRISARLLPGEIYIPRGKVIKTVILNSGIVVMLALYLFELAINLIPIQ